MTIYSEYDSPAKKHKQKVLAEKNIADTDHGKVVGSEYELLKLKFAEDKRALKALQSVKAKIELKAKLLPHYDTWIDATLDHGTGKDDSLLPLLMLWHIDAANFERGLDIAEYLLKHDMSMPDTHQRTLATVIAEEVADTTNRLIAEKTQFDEAQVLRAATITAQQDMPDQVRAKLAKVIGEITEEADPQSALEYYEVALQYNDKIGVKTKIKQLTKQLEQDESQ